MRGSRKAGGRALSASLGALAIAACQTPDAPPPLRIPQADVGQFPTLCLTPLRSEVDDPPRVANVEALLAEALRQRGFGVVPASETAPALDRITREEGGFYDVDTGERRPDFEAVSRRVRERAGAELSCQALVRARIVLVMAPWMTGMFTEGSAFWDGVKEHLDVNRDASGAIGALSIHIRVLDPSDRELYFGAGGIRTISALEAGFASIEFVPLDPTKLLADAQRNRTAIDIALRGLRLAR